MLILNIFTRRSRKRRSKELSVAYTIAESNVTELPEEKEGLRKIVRIPVSSKDLQVEVDESTGLIFVFNSKRPYDHPWNIGTFIRNRFLILSSKNAYWY